MLKDQTKYFKELDFKKSEEVEGNYVGADGAYYCISHFGSTYCIERAMTKEEAVKGWHEDVFLMDDDADDDAITVTIREKLEELLKEPKV